MKRPALLTALLLLLVTAALVAYRGLAPISPESFLDRWSLLRIPPEFQRTFRILLLVPVGTLVVSIMHGLETLESNGGG